MVVVPLSVFFYLRSYYEYNDPDRDLWPAIAAVLTVNFIMVCITIWKHADDFKAVFIDGTGDIPYDPALRE